MKKNKKGFTLIELLIVVAIITILAAGVVVGINPAKHFKDTRNATRLTQMNTIAGALYSYAIGKGGALPSGCPPPWDEVNNVGVTTSLTADASCTEALVPSYIQVMPTPPLPDEDYWIQEASSEGGIKITSSAEEASGTAEVIQ